MTLEPGVVLEGKVINITNFGAFVEVEGKTGMVHISEVANNYIKDINEVLKPGDVVKVKVLTMDPNGKMSLSIKQAEPLVERTKKTYSKPNTRFDDNNNDRDRKSSEPSSFEDMMKSFQKVSEERVSEYKRRAEGTNNKKRRS